MFARLADVVTRRWWLIFLIWIGALILVRVAAPPWESITLDGDFAYLPPGKTSVKGERWMATAFPHQRGKSQLVIAIERLSAKLSNHDIQVAYDVARRIKNLLGCVRYREATGWAQQEAEHRTGNSPRAAEQAHQRFLEAAQAADAAFAEAIELDAKLTDYWDDRIEDEPADAPIRPGRLSYAYHNRALVSGLLGDAEAATRYREASVLIDPRLADAGRGMLPLGADRLPLVDVWTWRDQYFGEKLISRNHRVRLVVLQLSNEFMATANIGVLRTIEAELELARADLDRKTTPGLAVLQSGSAAVGTDLLRSAAASIQKTEIFTVVLVIIILALVYRAPLLVAVPIATIGISLALSTGIVALLTQLSSVPGFSWWTLKVFSTTKIFIVVILFGAGTDYCLFLIARYKEELQAGLPSDRAVSAALMRVGDALAASALTTILGLGMMFFADFGKFRYSGPIIGLCLAITLLTCVTLTPAILRGLGPLLFWPFGVKRLLEDEDATARRRTPASSAIWEFLARVIVARPGLILVTSVVGLMPLAVHGFQHGSDVTFDFLSSLPENCPSRVGAKTLRRHFPVGERGPITVLVHRPDAQFDTSDGREQIRDLTDRLYLPGVLRVCSAEDPLGDFYAPDEEPGYVSERARRLRILRAHPRTKALFVAQIPELAGSVARFELIPDVDPFSADALLVVDGVERMLKALTKDPESFWHNANFAIAGTTSAIRDLRAVTFGDENRWGDNKRIQVLVVLSVFFVLLIILRRPLVCFYMMLSVLFSYYVTMGIVTLFFAWCYGDSYQGLDWKVPLFLFVILVAVGQDYNVYLATRVIEEQRRLGPFSGLRRAVVRTGGIITSCGVIMAGTFISMTSATWTSVLPAEWLPATASSGALRSIVELGFAPSLGVLLDTFVVRPILVPAFLALLCRWQAVRRRVPTD